MVLVYFFFLLFLFSSIILIIDSKYITCSDERSPFALPSISEHTDFSMLNAFRWMPSSSISASSPQSPMNYLKASLSELHMKVFNSSSLWSPFSPATKMIFSKLHPSIKDPTHASITYVALSSSDISSVRLDFGILSLHLLTFSVAWELLFAAGLDFGILSLTFLPFRLQEMHFRF